MSRITEPSKRRRPGQPGVLTVLLLLTSVSGCVGPFSDLQNARTLAPGALQFTGGYSYIQFSDDDGREKLQDVFGLHLGRGLTEAIDLRLRYDLISVEDERVSAVGFGPKFGLVRDRLALFTPIGFGFGGGIETSETWQFQPTLLYTVPVSQQFEVTTSTKGLIWLNADDTDNLLAFNVGLGISRDLDRWALRPEVGYLIDPGEDGSVWGFSLGYSRTVGPSR